MTGGSAIPGKFRPAWRRLPGLAVAASRAYAAAAAPRPLWGLCAAAGWPGWLLALALLRRCVAAHPHQSALVVITCATPRRQRWGLGALAALLSGWVYIGARFPSEALIPAVWCALALLPHLRRPAPTLRALSAQRALTAWLRAQYPGAPILLAGSFAAWPPGRRAGFDLAAELLAQPLPGPVIVLARTPDLARRYTALGLRPDPSHPHLLWLSPSDV